MTFGSSVEEMKGSADELGEIHEPLKEKLTEGEWFNKKRKELLEEFDDVLVDRIPKDWLPPLRPGMDHEIPLIDGECKYPSRPLRLPRVYEREVRQHWEDMVKLGTAIPAPQDKQSSPLFTVAKKEPGRFREVYDLRARNANTKKQQIMLPHREEIIAKLAGARYISKFDLPDCFLQFRVRPEDVKHTTVATPFGQFRMKLMQMGDTNAPATCQRAMWVIAEGLQGKGLLVFVDDGWLVTTGVKRGTSRSDKGSTKEVSKIQISSLDDEIWILHGSGQCARRNKEQCGGVQSTRGEENRSNRELSNT